MWGRTHGHHLYDLCAADMRSVKLFSHLLITYFTQLPVYLDLYLLTYLHTSSARRHHAGSAATTLVKVSATANGIHYSSSIAVQCTGASQAGTAAVTVGRLLPRRRHRSSASPINSQLQLHHYQYKLHTSSVIVHCCCRTTTLEQSANATRPSA